MRFNPRTLMWEQDTHANDNYAFQMAVNAVNGTIHQHYITVDGGVAQIENLAAVKHHLCSRPFLEIAERVVMGTFQNAVNRGDMETANNALNKVLAYIRQNAPRNGVVVHF